MQKEKTQTVCAGDYGACTAAMPPWLLEDFVKKEQLGEGPRRAAHSSISKFTKLCIFLIPVFCHKWYVFTVVRNAAFYKWVCVFGKPDS